MKTCRNELSSFNASKGVRGGGGGGGGVKRDGAGNDIQSTHRIRQIILINVMKTLLSTVG